MGVTGVGLVFIAGDYPSHPVEHNKEARENNYKTKANVILQVTLGYALEGMLDTFKVH